MIYQMILIYENHGVQFWADTHSHAHTFGDT